MGVSASSLRAEAEKRSSAENGRSVAMRRRRKDAKKNRGHHLADPDQRHALFLRARVTIFLVAQWGSNPLHTLGFHSGADGVVTDPHQSPFWSKALGLPLSGSYQAPGCSQPQKFLGSLSRPSVANRS